MVGGCLCALGEVSRMKFGGLKSNGEAGFKGRRRIKGTREKIKKKQLDVESNN